MGITQNSNHKKHEGRAMKPNHLSIAANDRALSAEEAALLYIVS